MRISPISSISFKGKDNKVEDNNNIQKVKPPKRDGIIKRTINALKETDEPTPEEKETLQELNYMV